MKQIKVYGLGGQGVVTGAKVFAEAVAIYEEKYAQSIPAYGHERRGAPVYSDVVTSDEPIKIKSFVYAPDVVVIFDLAVIEKNVDVMAGTTKGTIFVINSQSMPKDAPFVHHKTFFVDAQRIALDSLGVDIPNTTMLGALAAAGLVGIEATKAAIFANFPKAASKNTEAAERAFHETVAH